MLVLVGANGFLGRHTCELLERRGEPAIAVSRKPDPKFFERFAPSVTCMSAAEFASAAGTEVIAQARAIVYFTWGSGPATFAEKPWRELPENVQPAFEFFLRVASISPATKIVFMSSGGTVYGSNGTEPRKETSPTRPISPYGVGKLMAEDALRFVGRTKTFPYAILRTSNAIGRWQTSKTQGIVAAALRAARDGIPLRLYGRGCQTRDFVDADDVAEAILAASLDTKHPATTWNVGSGIGIVVADLLSLLSQIIGWPIPIEPAPARDLDVPHIVLNCQKIADDLGWTAKTPIECSLERICRSQLQPSRVRGF